MQNKLIFLIFLISLNTTSFAEQSENSIIEKCFIVDGPANVRKKPKSKIVMSLNNYEVTKVLKKEGDWLLISEPIKPLFNKYFFPSRCLAKKKLKPIGWTHKNNLKFFPVPLIKKTSTGIKLLNLPTIIKSLSEYELGMGKLSINFFRDSTEKITYWGGAIIDQGDMLPQDAYFFNEDKIVKIEHKGEHIKFSDKGFVVIERLDPMNASSCEFITTLILPTLKKQFISKDTGDPIICGAG